MIPHPITNPIAWPTLNHFTLDRHPTELSGSARARTARRWPTRWSSGDSSSHHGVSASVSQAAPAAKQSIQSSIVLGLFALWWTCSNGARVLVYAVLLQAKRALPHGQHQTL